MQYAEVAVWLPVNGTFHYRIPEDARERPLPGARVLVTFGRRSVTGTVLALSDSAPADVAEIKPIDAVLDAERRLSGELLALCSWIADFYEAPIGEVVRTAMPAGMQVTASTRVELSEAGQAALTGTVGGALSRTTRDVLAALLGAGGAMARSELVRQVGRRGIRTGDIESLRAAGLIRYGRASGRAGIRPRTERTAVIARPITDSDRATLARAPKKLAALRLLEQAGGSAAVSALKAAEPRIAAHLRALAKADLVRFEDREAAPGVATSGILADGQAAPPALNERQRAALAAIRTGLRTGRFSPYLLHGITGSGKTEVYLNAIADVLEAGRTAIVLVPEIALTPQLAARFRARFGDQVAVLHSGLTSRERFDEWLRLEQGSARIALGARSAVFAPVTDVGIVVVDEEHDSSFKQDEGVRYNGRDVALVRAQRARAVCVLGSATPSVESYRAAQTGRYQLLSLPKRATPRPLPKVELIDLRVYQAESEAMLTAPLSTAINEALEREEQVILFLNRRGFSTFVLCRACGHAFRCTQCSVSLTYHRAIDRLLCHYCGFSMRVPGDCPACKQSGAIVRR
ncbi:MAG: primosomal protein N', partial [Myxococcota bacterium]